MKKFLSMMFLVIISAAVIWAQPSAVFYNGDEGVDDLSVWDWGFSVTPAAAENAGYTPGTPAMKWTGYDGSTGYQGLFFGKSTALDLTSDWEDTYVRFKIKAPRGLPESAPLLNVLIYDSRSDDWSHSIYYEIASFQSLQDSAWHSFEIKISDFVQYGDAIDKADIKAVSFEYFDTGLDQELLIDEVTIGDPMLENDLMVFDGIDVLPGVGFEAWGFEDNSLTISEGEGMYGTNAIRWETSNWNWQGQSFSFAPQNMITSWMTDTIEFFIKAPADINDLSIGFYDIDGNAVWHPMSADDFGFDGNWKKIQLPLQDFELYWDSFDTTQVTQFKIENAADNVTVPELLLFDYISLKPTNIQPDEPVEETASMMFVNGGVMSDMYLWPWGFNTDPMEVESMGYTPGTSAIKWQTYSGSGSQGLFIGTSDNVGHDLTEIWATDSVHFMLKAPDGISGSDSLDIVIYDTRNDDWNYAVKMNIENLQDLNDGEWHQFSLPLAEFEEFENPINPSEIAAVSFESNTGVAAQLLIDKVWIGDPQVNVTMTLFNGQSLAEGITFDAWGFNNNDLELAEGEGYLPGTPALLWESSNWDWQGKSFGFMPQNFSDAWSMDTLKIKVKAPAGINDLAFRWIDLNGTEFQKVIDENWDGEWQKLELPLKSFVAPLEFDKSRVTEFAILADSLTIPERILFDDIWIGDPAIATDFTAPNPPASVTVMADPSYPHVNMVIWDDVEGENDEKYAVYASRSPITDLNADNVFLLAEGIEENVNIYAHHIFHPVTEGDVTYYYAMTCTDASSNVSETFTMSDAFTNSGKKRAIINYGAPEDLALDGYFDEWAGVAPFVVKPEEGVVVEGSIDDSTDCMAKCYAAIDDEYLYIGFDVYDDAFTWSESNTVDWWNDESIEMFIGFYGISGTVSHHNNWQRGAEPDYRIVFTPEKLTIDAWPGIDSIMAGSDDYYFESGGTADYYIEARISLEMMANIDGDSMFVPEEEMKIPFEIQVNDADEANVGTVDRMQLGTNSTDDAWWNAPNIWTFTWIGIPDIVAIDDENEMTPLTFELENNYPNPFNPTTVINYSIPKTEEVSLNIYNMLGQKVKTLVNAQQAAGKYSVTFDAANLSSGLYFYKIKAGQNIKVKKMMLIK